MPARQESCCFTGHRPAKLPWGYNERDPRCVRLKERIADAVLLAYQEGYRHFLCGMAQGCDLYFCEAVLALRERYQEVTVEAAIPCPTQADAWPEAERGSLPGIGCPVRYGDHGLRHLFFHLYAAAGPLHGGSRHAAHRRL